MTKRTLFTWVALGASAVGIAAMVVAVRSGQASRSARADHAPTSLDTSEKRPPTARAGAIGLPPAAVVRRRTALARASAPSPGAPPSTGLPEPGTQPGAQISEEQLKLERRWDEQASNVQWTEEASAYVESAMDVANIPRDRLESLDCHGDLCRMEIRFVSEQEAGGLYELRNPDYDVKFFRDGEYYTLFVSRLDPQAPSRDEQSLAQAAQPAPENAHVSPAPR